VVDVVERKIVAHAVNTAALIVKDLFGSFYHKARALSTEVVLAAGAH
jgi:hypothetical protein